MPYFTIAIVLTGLFYVVALYFSYVSLWIFYKGIKYRLISPALKSSAFIIFCYISIITDIALFNYSAYIDIIVKNGLLTSLSIFSLVYTGN